MEGRALGSGRLDASTRARDDPRLPLTIETIDSQAVGRNASTAAVFCWQTFTREEARWLVFHTSTPHV